MNVYQSVKKAGATMENKIIKTFIIIIVLSCTLLLAWSLVDEQRQGVQTPILEKVKIIGTYTTSSTSLPAIIPLDISNTLPEDESLIITGSFTKNIPQNMLVMLRVNNIKLELYLNGQLLYEYGTDIHQHFEYKANGNLWTYFVSPGISTEDTIEIHLENPYGSQGITPYAELLSQIYFGYDGGLYSDMFAKNVVRLFAAMFIICLGLVLLLISLVLLFQKYDNISRFFYLSGFTISSGLWLSLYYIFTNYLPS